jgi:ribonucleoside-diphosphate reductase beta chain
LGIKNVFEETQNPIKWIKNWTESKHVQVAPQETQIETYKVGSFKQDTSETDFSDFNF